MKKYSLYAFLICLLASCTIKTGSGNIVEETRSVEAFHAISVGHGMELSVIQAATQSVKIEADDNIIGDIQAVVKDGVLFIEFDNNVSLQNAAIHIYVSTNQGIDQISAGAGSSVEAKAALEHKKGIELIASSGSSMHIVVDAPEIKVVADGGASVDVKGEARHLIVVASGGSSVDADDLKSETSNLQASGGASVNAFASIEVNAQASGGGSVQYSGPETLRVKKIESSGGSVSKD